MLYCVYTTCRIPLPELKDSDKLDKIMYMKEATKRLRLGPEALPSICFYTFLNSYQVGSWELVCVLATRFSKKHVSLIQISITGKRDGPSCSNLI